MFKHLVLLAGMILLVGCQEFEPPPRSLAPPLVYREQPRPLPPAPRSVYIGPGPRVRTQTSYRYESRQYVQPRPARAPLVGPRRSAVASAAVPREWVPSASANPWRWIVIHHSDTSVGSASSFDQYHRNVRHWDELGYHFVIGNGTGSGDGRVEVGSRWTKQKWGAHAGVAIYNEYGIGICLVGDFNKTRPGSAQMQALAKLVAYLMRTYHIPAERVIGHRDCKRTDCPGRYLNLSTVRRMAASY